MPRASAFPNPIPVYFLSDVFLSLRLDTGCSRRVSPPSRAAPQHPELTFQAGSCQSLCWVAVKLTQFKGSNFFFTRSPKLDRALLRLPNYLMETLLSLTYARVSFLYPMNTTRDVNKDGNQWLWLPAVSSVRSVVPKTIQIGRSPRGAAFKPKAPRMKPSSSRR